MLYFKQQIYEQHHDKIWFEIITVSGIKKELKEK